MICDMNQKYDQLKAFYKWPEITKGDLIDVIAPASSCQLQDLEHGVQFLETRGFRVRVPQDIFSSQSAILAQEDSIRFAHLKAALQAKDSKMIWCVRGGYGALRLIPQLAKLKRPKICKILLGYSDVTTLHNFLNGFWKWPTLHAPLLDRFGKGSQTKIEELEVFDLLLNTESQVMHKNLVPLNELAHKKQVVNAGIVGGNLTVLVSSLGTPWHVQPKGQIVFFEDLGERPHRLDRMFSQLIQSGFFKNAKAIIFGDMLVKEETDQKVMWEEVIPRFADHVRKPVFKGLEAGHGPIQRPIPLMASSRLDFDKRTLTVCRP